MRFTKILALILTACILFTLSACGQKDLPPDDTSSTVAEEIKNINRLTGEALEKESDKNIRPVAIMINNMSTAQKVQSGVTYADIVFETEVEGGITRMMAVFSDISKVPEDIGSVRSARVVYPHIAMGLGAVYFHAGSDDEYCTPEMKNIGVNSVDINRYAKYSFRKPNGLSSEHTLYTKAELLNKAIKDYDFEKVKKTEPFANFAENGETVTPGGSPAVKIEVPFSSSYVTKFTYDSATGKYNKQKPSGSCKESYKNIIILRTAMSHYPNGKHRLIDLTSGTGYYASNGMFQEIKWSKGDAEDAFVFTNMDDTPLTINVGSSYVGIMKDSSRPSFME
ncbi:MAG: DUF3048 domain-containing protein [Clostridia bacterium]|nr:DUF3048 domain-containing protein [Clostridia bacterium]